MQHNDTGLDSALADELKQAGWSASLDAGQLHVHVQLPGIYRQLTLERDAQAGVKLTSNLVNLAGLDNDVVRALTYFANAANARLPLVRMAFSGASLDRALRAEVAFGATLIPGEFLLMSLHAFETAIAHTAREMEALRDPQLARSLLAARAACELDD
jgi:hypothetical protein